jgi:hypothetical protein
MRADWADPGGSTGVSPGAPEQCGIPELTTVEMIPMTASLIIEDERARRLLALVGASDTQRETVPGSLARR